jgi:hypothetical protein
MANSNIGTQTIGISARKHLEAQLLSSQQESERLQGILLRSQQETQRLQELLHLMSNSPDAERILELLGRGI